MRLALGVMFKSDELGYLELHLPAFRHSFDGIVAVTDTGCDQTTLNFMLGLGAKVLISPWIHHWGHFATKLVQYAENLHYDAICRVDPDECLMPWAGHDIRHLLREQATLLLLPRYEFFGDRLHIRTDLYSDHQARAFRLNRGIIIQGRRHEGIDFAEHGLSEHSTDPETRVWRYMPDEERTLPDLHLYHYSWIGKQGIMRNQTKYTNHHRVEMGLPPVDHIDDPLVSFPTVEFKGKQPIDPHRCGLVAPFKE